MATRAPPDPAPAFIIRPAKVLFSLSPEVFGYAELWLAGADGPDALRVLGLDYVEQVMARLEDVRRADKYMTYWRPIDSRHLH